MTEKMFEEMEPELNNTETEEAANLVGPEKKVFQFTIEGTPEINPDIAPENFEAAVEESAEAQVEKATKEGGRRRVGRVAMAALSLMALMATTPMQAEAGGKNRHGDNDQRIEHVYKYKSTTRYEYGRRDSWKQVGMDTARAAIGRVMGGGTVVYGGGGRMLAGGVWVDGPTTFYEADALRARAEVEKARIEAQAAVDIEAIRAGRGVASDARQERQAPVEYIQREDIPLDNSQEAREEAPDNRTDIEKAEDMGRAYKIGNEDGQKEIEMAKNYGGEHPVLTKGRWEQIVTAHQGKEPDSYFKGFLYSWTTAGGIVDVK